MINQDFIDMAKSFFNECLTIMETKGAEYAGNNDKFANFKRLADKFGGYPELILMVYMTKHLDSIDSFIRKLIAGEKVTFIEAQLSEPIDGRIADTINYLLILKGMIAERRCQELVRGETR